eukprot:12431131-Karenia_brevis.AAC.1
MAPRFTSNEIPQTTISPTTKKGTKEKRDSVTKNPHAASSSLLNASKHENRSTNLATQDMPNYTFIKGSE